MKGLAFLLGLALTAVAAFFYLRFDGRETREEARAPAAAPDTGRDTAADDERLARLEQRMDELGLDLAALRRELARGSTERESAAPEDPRPASDAPTEPDGAQSALWYLQQYVASFAHGGTGSEYFRLAVEAFAPSLLREISALVLDRRTTPLLRLRLTAMLGDARFRGDGAAIDVLLRLLPSVGDEQLVEVALGALAQVGDARTAEALEAFVFSIQSPQNRWKALQVLVSLAGDAANLVLARLWPRAGEEGERAFLITQVRPDEGVASLELFTLASQASQPVRLQAAVAVRAFRFPGFPELIEEWLARERDEAVRAALGAAREELARAPSWSAQRATGPADANPNNDDPHAWASAQPDMGLQWLELTYDPPLRASQVRIFEVNVAGAISAVVATDVGGNEHELWSGVDPTSTPGVFELGVGPTSYRVASLRLTLDTNRHPDWSEIDAVELVGPDGRAWATSARASSSFGH